jgi:vesicle transport through interaction with t-SNAREs 1
MDTSPTALFDSYESDFQQIVTSIRDKLASDANVGGEVGKAALRRVEMELDEADEMVSDCSIFNHVLSKIILAGVQVSQMEIEIQGIPQSIRTSYQTRVRTAKQTLATLKKQVKDAHMSVGRNDLVGGRAGVTSHSLTQDARR